MAVLAVAFADDFAGGDIQGGKERGGAVAIVVVGSALRLSGFHRQNRLAAFQSLDLAFLIHAKHNGAGLFRRVEVKAHDVAHLFHKERIAGELESLFPVRLISSFHISTQRENSDRSAKTSSGRRNLHDAATVAGSPGCRPHCLAREALP